MTVIFILGRFMRFLGIKFIFPRNFFYQAFSIYCRGYHLLNRMTPMTSNIFTADSPVDIFCHFILILPVSPWPRAQWPAGRGRDVVRVLISVIWRGSSVESNYNQ